MPKEAHKSLASQRIRKIKLWPWVCLEGTLKNGGWEKAVFSGTTLVPWMVKPYYINSMPSSSWHVWRFVWRGTLDRLRGRKVIIRVYPDPIARKEHGSAEGPFLCLVLDFQGTMHIIQSTDISTRAFFVVGELERRQHDLATKDIGY